MARPGRGSRTRKGPRLDQQQQTSRTQFCDPRISSCALKTKRRLRSNNLNNSRAQIRYRVSRVWTMGQLTPRFNLTGRHSRQFRKATLRRCTEQTAKNQRIKGSLAQDSAGLQCTGRIQRRANLEVHPFEVA